MKKILLSTFAAMLFCFSLLAQNGKTSDDEIKTLFGNKPHSNGGYLGLGGGYTQIDSRDAFTASFRGAWIIDHSFAIGIAATGFSNDLYVGHSAGSNYSSIQGGYGGLLLQPVIFPKFPVHLSFPIVLGVGGAMAMNTHYYESYEAYLDIQDEAFYGVAEPAVEVELTLVKWIRASFGASYRFTTPLNLFGYSSDDLRGFTGSMTLSFGKF